MSLFPATTHPTVEALKDLYESLEEYERIQWDMGDVHSRQAFAKLRQAKEKALNRLRREGIEI
jgi:phage pi2 protein 07